MNNAATRKESEGLEETAMAMNSIDGGSGNDSIYVRAGDDQGSFLLESIVSNTIAGGDYHVPVSINGSRGNATNFLLDNADNNDGYTNIAEPYPNPDAVQEFSIQTSTFDAQYGRNVGGVVNVVTRSGTNSFHGTAFNFLRNYKLNAGNYFSGRDALKRNQFGGTFGGPVILPGYNG